MKKFKSDGTQISINEEEKMFKILHWGKNFEYYVEELVERGFEQKGAKSPASHQECTDGYILDGFSDESKTAVQMTQSGKGAWSTLYVSKETSERWTENH
jgi:hypothetical protein